MAERPTDRPDLAKLARIWRISSAAGVSATLGAALLTFDTLSLDAFIEDWPWLVAVLGVGVLAQSAIFFAWTSAVAPEMARYIVSEGDKIKPDGVERVTVYAETGDAALDGWIRAYAGARATTGWLLVALTMGGLALLFF